MLSSMAATSGTDTQTARTLRRLVAVLLLHFALLCSAVLVGACAESEDVICFPHVFSDTTDCVKVPSGTECLRNPLLDEIRCADEDGRIFYPEVLRVQPENASG